MGDSKALANAKEGKDSGSSLVIQRVVRETGDSWPMLNRTNYADWAFLMQVMLEACQLWVAVNDGMPERMTNHTDMECLLRSIPPEMLCTLAVKKTMKEAWETVKMMRLRVTRVRDVKASTLKKQLDTIKSNNGEDIDDFDMHLSFLVS